MSTLVHFVIRLYLSLLLVLFFFTGGLTMFLLAPLYKQAFAPQAAYRDFRPFKTWTHIYKIIWRSVSNRHYRGLYPFRMYDPPMYDNSQSQVQIKKSWAGATDNCDACKNSCCAQIGCPMIGPGGRCLSYGSVYFGYYFCGRYPENQGQMDLYDCPKWEVQPSESP
ncbi:MAG: hypothetical protein FWE32_06610 [Oscillospiraceae bacterium]|nr:hypothetical protein [Oscillospiraceae bacterium]